ncbi:sulfotransferase [Acuticoccus sp. I52.16.1]|uniref:sulfotransferase n=1 Tax=Acuticoccus sp. I52.16.1 TaxID=2928472 RepID=UPI001FD08CCA|nr:sulfotransferase [Acuticoccus sp. I52.16.1]UOM36774.1 sulfotransferase [Acuticoccus sp. I52.16.1]
MRRTLAEPEMVSASLPARAVRRARHHVLTHLQHAFTRVNERPVIVLGNQKSGTSALVSLLAAAAGKRATNDIFTWYGDMEGELLAGRMSFPEFVERARYHFSSAFVKDPSFTFMLPAVKTRFPEARFVFVVRDPRLNIRGILNRVEVPGTLADLDAAAFAQVRAQRPGWLPVLDGRGVVTEGTHVARLAHRCRIAMEIAAAHRTQWPVVRYEDFLADKPGTIAATLEAVGEQARHDIAPLADNPFQPPSRNRSTPADFFSPTNLTLIEEICGQAMTEFGYR